MTLDELREDINDLDSDILTLIAERFSVCKSIAKMKKTVDDPERERVLRDLWVEEASELGLSDAFALQILEIILQESKRIQRDA